MFRALAFGQSCDKGLSLKMSDLKLFRVANFHNQFTIPKYPIFVFLIYSSMEIYACMV